MTDVMEATTRRCARCGEHRPLGEFYKRPGDGRYGSYCAGCRSKPKASREAPSTREAVEPDGNGKRTPEERQAEAARARAERLASRPTFARGDLVEVAGDVRATCSVIGVKPNGLRGWRVEVLDPDGNGWSVTPDLIGRREQA